MATGSGAAQRPPKAAMLVAAIVPLAGVVWAALAPSKAREGRALPVPVAEPFSPR